MTRTIGLVGGMTPESTLEYYRLLIRSARERLRDPDPLRNPVVIVYSLDLAMMAGLQRTGRTDELAAHLAGICEILRASGAEVGALTANTPHLYFEAIQAGTRLELVSIVEATCRASVALGLRRPLLLGTRTTMESPMYSERLAADGIDVLIPDEQGRQCVDHAIYTELAVAGVRPETRSRLLALCREAVERRGADGVILGCTELPLVLAEGDLPVPVVDTARVHVEAILDRALA
ncbi:MAG: aspartate racemase [Holophagae bacterium]|nr:MAG: aspartate racemase [Holophagae bacterium]